jgi:hypothetical protein
LYKPTMNLRIVEWTMYSRIEQVTEQMWVDEKTGLVEWRELETITAKEAGYLDDTSSQNNRSSSNPPKKRMRAGA